MHTYIALLRGINVGGHKKIKMADLRELCESIGLVQPTTLLQSGNLAFRSESRDRARLTELLSESIENRFGFRCSVLVLGPSDIGSAVENMPFDTKTVDPKLLMVVFLDQKPGVAAQKKLRAACTGPEEIEFGEQHLYVYYTAGSARSKFTLAVIEKALEVTGTARNWNTTNKLLALADGIE